MAKDMDYGGFFPTYFLANWTDWPNKLWVNFGGIFSKHFATVQCTSLVLDFALISHFNTKK